MLKIAICDDERYELDKIVRGIKDNLYMQGISCYEINVYSSGVEFYWNIEELLGHDVIFLNIDIPEMNGLEIARKIREYGSPILLVFITAFIDYLLEGYKLEVTRVLFRGMLEDMLQECIEIIIKKRKIQAKKMSYVFLEGKQELFLDQICFIESQKHKLIFNIENHKTELQYSLYGKLDYLEDELNQYGFLRIHKSYLVNLKWIKEIAHYRVKLKNGEMLPIPREKFQKVKEKYEEQTSGEHQ